MKRLRHPVKICILTGKEAEDNSVHSLCISAHGYLVKPSLATKLVESIQDIIEGTFPLKSTRAWLVLTPLEEPEIQFKYSNSYKSCLTGREDQILQGLMQGFRIKEIAAKLGIAEDSVKKRLGPIYRKLNAKTATQAVSNYMKGSMSLCAADQCPLKRTLCFLTILGRNSEKVLN